MVGITTVHHEHGTSKGGETAMPPDLVQALGLVAAVFALMLFVTWIAIKLR